MRSYAVRLFIKVIRLYYDSPNHKSENTGSMQQSALGYLRNRVISHRKKGAKHTSKHAEPPGAYVDRILTSSSHYHSLKQNFLLAQSQSDALSSVISLNMPELSGLVRSIKW